MTVYYVEVRNRIARLTKKEGHPVGGNKGDTVVFDFDSEWESSQDKVALFIWGGKYFPVEFVGNECEVPPIDNSNKFRLGVYVGETVDDSSYIASTVIEIPCELSIRDYAISARPEVGKNYTYEAKGYAKQAQEAAERAEAASGGGSGGTKSFFLTYSDATTTDTSTTLWFTGVTNTIGNKYLTRLVTKLTAYGQTLAVQIQNTQSVVGTAYDAGTIMFNITDIGVCEPFYAMLAIHSSGATLDFEYDTLTEDMQTIIQTIQYSDYIRVDYEEA